MFWFIFFITWPWIILHRLTSADKNERTYTLCLLPSFLDIFHPCMCFTIVLLSINWQVKLVLKSIIVLWIFCWRWCNDVVGVFIVYIAIRLYDVVAACHFSTIICHCDGVIRLNNDGYYKKLYWNYISCLDTAVSCCWHRDFISSSK